MEIIKFISSRGVFLILGLALIIVYFKRKNKK